MRLSQLLSLLLPQVPEKLMLSANTALSSKHCGKLVKQAELSEWQVGLAQLLDEVAKNGRGRRGGVVWQAGQNMYSFLSGRCAQ